MRPIWYARIVLVASNMMGLAMNIYWQGTGVFGAFLNGLTINVILTVLFIFVKPLNNLYYTWKNEEKMTK